METAVRREVFPPGRELAEAASVGESEDLLSSACWQAGCGIMIADNEANIQFVNERFSEITGYDAAEVIGKNPRMLQSGMTSRDTYLALWNEVSSGRTWRGTLRNRRKNGELFWESINISPITDERGAITHFVAIIEDVTESIRKESLARREAEETSQQEKWESFSTMADGIAHEMNNLLTGVVAQADLAILAENPSSSLLEKLEGIREAGIRASRLLTQLADFTSGLPVTKVPLSLRALTRRYLAEYEARLEGAMKLRWEPTRDPCLALGSESLLNQALLELLANSVEASFPDTTITIGCGYLASEIARDGVESEPDLSLGLGPVGWPVVFLEVRDQGGGMDEETLNRAFDPFFSAKPGRKGLGLTRLMGIVSGHGGGVRVWTQLGEGTTVRIVLPALHG